jgi:hypothetical protein
VTGTYTLRNYNDQVKEESVCSTKGGYDECMSGFGGETRSKETTAKPRHRWVDNIKMNLREIEWGDMDWIHLA